MRFKYSESLQNKKIQKKLVGYFSNNLTKYVYDSKTSPMGTFDKYIFDIMLIRFGLKWKEVVKSLNISIFGETKMHLMKMSVRQNELLVVVGFAIMLYFESTIFTLLENTSRKTQFYIQNFNFVNTYSERLYPMIL